VVVDHSTISSCSALHALRLAEGQIQRQQQPSAFLSRIQLLCCHRVQHRAARFGVCEP
jgi:hypothetical protein